MEHKPFPKIPRLNREIIITEKIDGTNAAITVMPDGTLYAQSRNRIITPGSDNAGFAAWVFDHADDLRELGEGTHYGEWYGRGIQRGYGLNERRFAMFNTTRWSGDSTFLHLHERIPQLELVPLLYRGAWVEDGKYMPDAMLDLLRSTGSFVTDENVPAEGIVIYHTAGNLLFKALCENDSLPKGPQNDAT